MLSVLHVQRMAEEPVYALVLIESEEVAEFEQVKEHRVEQSHDCGH